MLRYGTGGAGMRHGRLAVPVLAGLCAPGALGAQDAGDRLVALASVLNDASGSSSADRIQAIREIASLGVRSGLAAGLLFDRASALREPDPDVREAAALALREACELRNRAQALRVVRLARAAFEPEPRVRKGALRTLAAFQVSEAASAVLDATSEAKEPDASVRDYARELVAKGLAAEAY